MGKVSVVGIGPGGADFLTGQARKALDDADTICGYKTYVDLIRPVYPGKNTETTQMTQETERCRRALQLAEEGHNVALVCSGDSGIYGMAGPLIELSADFPEAETEIISGVTAASSGAAVLGAPLMNDFCVLSLSDILTPWEQIERRLRLAGEADLVICLYNPASHSRTENLAKACEILMETRSPDTLCGWVRNIGRDGQEHKILTLKELKNEKVDMTTTVFIGSSGTRQIGDRLVTVRGYNL